MAKSAIATPAAALSTRGSGARLLSPIARTPREDLLDLADCPDAAASQPLISITQIRRSAVNVSLPSASLLGASTTIALTDENGRYLAVAPFISSPQRLSWSDDFSPRALKAHAVSDTCAAYDSGPSTDTWRAVVERFGASNRGSNHDEDPSAAERSRYLPSLAVVDFAARTARVAVERGPPLAFLALFDGHHAIDGFAAFDDVIYVPSDGRFEASWPFGPDARRLRLCAAVRNALLCDELSLEALHIAELRAHTTPAECDGCLSWRLAAGGASAPRAVARSDEAVCNGTTATLYVVALPAAERGSGEPASGEAEEEHGSGDGDGGERALAYTQGSEARVALPARDDGGAVVAHLACNGERFFMALPLHALWAEHDARVAAEVLQPHIDPITEIVAVIDRDLVGNDLAIDTIHPAMRLHGMTELLAVSVAILALCTAVHLVWRPRRRRPPVLRRSQLSPQQRTRGMLGGGNPRRWIRGAGRSGSAQELWPGGGRASSTEMVDLRV